MKCSLRFLLAHAEAIQQVVEGRAADAEQVGGLGQVSIGARECTHDFAPLGCIPRLAQVQRLILRARDLEREVARLDDLTVGKNHGAAPSLGEGVVLYPNSAIIGDCEIGDGSVIAQGVSVINRDTPGGGMVFQGSAGELVFKAPTRDVLADIFR